MIVTNTTIDLTSLTSVILGVVQRRKQEICLEIENKTRIGVNNRGVQQGPSER